MPNTKSAQKRLRQNVLRRQRNRSVKSVIRTQIRKVREAVADGDLDAAAEEFRRAAKQLDRAGARNVVHPNKAARHKSRLQKLIKRAKQDR
jgi:small subunit ribosomal protein S20